jgi:hypothetical protein
MMYYIKGLFVIIFIFKLTRIEFSEFTYIVYIYNIYK